MGSRIVGVCAWSSSQGFQLARRGVVLAVLSIFWALTSCAASDNEVLHVRIYNATDADMTAFWLGAGSGYGGPGSRAYGAIARGQTTPYRRLKAHFGSYSNYNFLIPSGRRYLGSVVSNDLIGRFSLTPGYYTFVITIEDEKARLEIVHDESR